MSILDIAKRKVFIIAEAGVNHGGDIQVAKRLIDVAKEAGADAVKFQAFRTDQLILDDVAQANYQKVNSKGFNSQSEMLKSLELQRHHYSLLNNYCIEKKIKFLITPFDQVSLGELEIIGMDTYKIASTDTTNIPFLRKIAATGKDIILSTGMCYMDEVEIAVSSILAVNKNLVLMQCTANYPVEDHEANLNVITTYKEKFPQVVLGFSDHTKGLGASLYAIPMGARVVEKHFTLDNGAEGPDHLASLNPQQLMEYVEEIRKIERYLGDFHKTITPSEKENRKSLQKCLVMAKKLPKGHIVQPDDVVAKRTGGKGISPIFIDKVVGLQLQRDYEENEILEADLA